MIKGSRKGQYLAIETVLSLGISIVVATAVIGAFNSYRSSVVDDVQERHIDIINSEIIRTVYNLKYMDSGSGITLDLPQPQTGEYTVSLQDSQVRVDTGSGVDSQVIDGARWASGFSGSTSSSEVKIMKLENEVVLRPG
ncbi:hypothetical protein ACK3SF_02085 [Candidatus Nanosalina sp. VS9-1]|uniref:hypothetical protein n=1 Tax=Candidatus Nanosalina sp. VS9-1 TaxID=3388566 RepID=UPI0039E021D9